MKLKLICAALLLLLAPAVKAVEINEIMYNPAGDDSGKEWIEIFNPQQIDLANWTIGDLKANDTLVPLKMTNSSFALIVESETIFNETNASVYYAGPLIGNGLGNSGNTIFLFNPGGDIVDFVVYTGELANGNNKTLEKFNGSWHESLIEGGTPGAENSVSFFYENTGNSSDNSTANETGETGANSTNTTETNSTGINSTDEEKCVAMISITTAKDIFVEEAIKFRHIVNSSAEFSIVYWVEDLFGTVVKAEYETKTLTEKSFTPRPKETDRVYVIKSKLRGCEEASAEKMVVYRKRSETTLDAGNEEKDEEKETEAVAATAEQGQTKQKFSYELISYSEQVFQNSEAYAVVKIESDDKAHIINMSAYLYRGSKKYSEVAVYEFTLDKYSSEAVELKFFTNATAGDYKMKIKINKDRQKTDYEIAVNVTVVEAEEAALREDSESSELLSKAEPVQPQNSTKPAENEADGNAKKNTAEGQESYRSSKAKSEHLIPVLLISILAAVSAVLIWKR